MALQRLTEVHKKDKEPKDSRFTEDFEKCSCEDNPDPHCPIHKKRRKRETRLRGH